MGKPLGDAALDQIFRTATHPPRLDRVKTRPKS